MDSLLPAYAALAEVLSGLAPCLVAVSGGVDSLTLAVAAGRVLGGRALMVHAVSPAVPAEDTARVKAVAAAEGFALKLVATGEIDDPDYRRNPADRCYFCKSRLYGTLARAARESFPGSGTVFLLSGANTDDLSDYRPGMEAAKRFGVRHPLIEAGLAKADVRALARALGQAFADIPASPCLSSRIYTGTEVTPERLAAVAFAESFLRRETGVAVLRCRLEGEVMRLEFDPAALADPEANPRLLAAAAALRAELAGRRSCVAAVVLEPEGYRTGRAFKRAV